MKRNTAMRSLRGSASLLVCCLAACSLPVPAPVPDAAPARALETARPLAPAVVPAPSVTAIPAPSPAPLAAGPSPAAVPSQPPPPVPSLPVPASQPFITRLAGIASGTAGFADGPAEQAKFAAPHGIAFDGAGNLLVADTFNHRIRKITPGGTVVTLAGSGKPGFADGTGEAAAFNYPFSIAVDPQGTAYVLDYSDNPRIRRLAPDGTVSTLVDGKQVKPVSFDPNGNGLAADNRGNLYVTAERKVLQIDVKTGQVISAADVPAKPGGPPAAPRGIAVGPQQQVYVTEAASHRILEIQPDGSIKILAGTGQSGFADGPAAAASFSRPFGIALDAQGTLFIADTGNQHLRKLAPGGQAASVAGARIKGFSQVLAAMAQFSQPAGLAIDGSGKVYVTDTGSHGIWKIDPLATLPLPDAPAAGEPIVTTLAGRGDPDTLNPESRDGTLAEAQIKFLGEIALDAAGNVYLDDNGFIRKIATDGQVVTTLGGEAMTDTLCRPHSPLAGLAFDRDGFLYTRDSRHHAICQITPSGSISLFAGTGKQGFDDGPALSATFNSPGSMVADSRRNLYVPDCGNNVIRKVSPDGKVSIFAGSKSEGGEDGPAAQATFRCPRYLAIDSQDNIYLGDAWFHRIRKITPAGQVTTLAGGGEPGTLGEGFADGQGTAARFDGPYGLAVDAEGNVFAADGKNNRIRKITPGGLVSTFAGSGATGMDDGPALAASFRHPTYLAFDGKGNLYVADTYNKRIRKISPQK